MIAKGIDEPDSCNQVLKDLSSLIQRFCESGHEVLLMIGTNESSAQGTRWKAFMESNLLHDVQSTRVPSMPSSTRISSPSRIDQWWQQRASFATSQWLVS